MLDWQETIAWLRNKIKAPVVTLRLIVIEDSGPDPLLKRFHKAGAYGAPETLFEAYMALIGPLKQLAEGPDGLARFYADLCDPERGAAEEDDDDVTLDDDDGEKRGALRTTAQRLVTTERYDAMGDTTVESAQSHWQHIHYHHTHYAVYLSSPGHNSFH